MMYKIHFFRIGTQQLQNENILFELPSIVFVKKMILLMKKLLTLCTLNANNVSFRKERVNVDPNFEKTSFSIQILEGEKCYRLTTCSYIFLAFFFAAFKKFSSI